MDNNHSNRNFHLQSIKKLCDYDSKRIRKALQGTQRNYKGGIAPFVRRIGFTDEMAKMSLKEFYAYIHEQELQEEQEKGGDDNE